MTPAPAIVRLPQLIAGTEIHTIAITAPGRDGERLATAALAEAVLGSALGHHPDGAPYAEAAPSAAISVSHGAGRALLAVAEGCDAIGVDIESTEREEQLRRVAPRFVGADDDPALSLLSLWTAKEAVYKAMRRPGLSLTAIAVGQRSATVDGREAARLAWLDLPGALVCLAVRL